MAATTAIAWTDSTFNPWMGCMKVSPGCDHCDAEAVMDRCWHRVAWGAGQPRQRTSAANWQQPRRWQAQHAAFAAAHGGRRRRVFCASLADVFDAEAPAEWRADLFRLIAQTPQLDWRLLTKRIGNVPRLVAAPHPARLGACAAPAVRCPAGALLLQAMGRYPRRGRRLQPGRRPSQGLADDGGMNGAMRQERPTP